MTWQEQRVALYPTVPGAQFLTAVAPVALAAGSQVVGFLGTSVPLNLQDLSNSGIPQTRAYSQLGVELVWSGAAPTGQLIVQGSISGLAASFATLSSPDGGSQNPDLLPPDDSNEITPTPPTFGSQIPNLVNLNGTPGSAILSWDLRKLRLNYLQVLAITSGNVTLLATVSLMYQT